MNYYISFGNANDVYADTWTLLQHVGGVKIQIGKSVEGESFISSIKRNLSILFDLAKLYVKRFDNDDCLVVLLPWPKPLKRLFYRVLLSKKVSLYVVMVDLECARNEVYDEEQEKQICSRSKSILVQSEGMRQIMTERGYASEVTRFATGKFWPILTDAQPVGESAFGNSIAFSGNPQRAVFVSKLSSVDSRLQFNVNSSFRIITEDWGLVWDGESLETCQGRIGLVEKYFKIVYPYRASLYLASNRPLIAWSQSAIAQFVVENHLGIAVDSLFDIYENISSLSDDDKALMKKNVAIWCHKVRTGEERIKELKEMMQD